MGSYKTRAVLEDENRALQLALEDVLDIINKPGRYHHRFVYEPTAAPRDELSPPGAKGAREIVTRAKHVLGRAKASK